MGVAVPRAPAESGFRNPLKSLVTGPILLVNCYIEIKFNKKISVNPPPPPLVPTSSPPRIIDRNYFLNPLPKQELRFSHIIIILSQPTFDLRPMPKYSSTLNVGIRRSFKFGLFLSLVSILNRSLEHNLMLANDSWSQKRR